jgi:trigger factor
MDIEVTKLPESRVALKITLTPAEVDQAMERTYKQLVQRVNVPGFRKGKAPRLIVERVVGPELFLHEATDEAVQWGYRRAISQEHITPIDEAEVKPADENSHDHLHAGEGFQFEATVSVRPEVQIPDYRTIKLARTEVVVSDDDVSALLTDLRQRNATLEPASRPAQLGDVVTMKVTARVDGETVIDEDNQDFELFDEEAAGAGPHSIFPGLAAKMVGANRGDIREEILHLPELYPNPELAGKTMILNILVKEIKRKVLPDLDDDFASSVSDLETLDELKRVLRANVELERGIEAEQKLASEAVDAVVSRSFGDIPPVLVEEQIDLEMTDLEQMLTSNRLTLQGYYEATGRSEADLRQEMRESAVKAVKTSLVLSAVADREGIEISNRELELALDEVTRPMSISETERRRLRSSTNVRSNLRSRLRRQRAIAELVKIVTDGGEVSADAAASVADLPSNATDTAETFAVEVGG